MMKAIAIIPARSGSKGLKDKNILQLNGKPLIAHTIEAAIESGCFDEVHVSTDSEHYAEIAREFGASVPFLRSLDNSSDSASSWDVVSEVLERYSHRFSREFDVVALLQPTSPLRNFREIQCAMTFFEEKEACSVISVCEAEHSPLWCNTIGDDLSMERFALTERGGNRQSLETYYRINGAIYIMKTDALPNVDDIYENRCYAYLMDKTVSVDIDDEFDFFVADAAMKAQAAGI